MKQLRVLLALFVLSCTLSAQDLYDINHIPEIRIQFKHQNWAHKLDSLKRDGKKKRVSAKVTIDGQVFEKVGVRFKGNSSYFNVHKTGSNKLPFNMKANYKKDKQRFPGGYETIKLSNVFRDPSFLREAMSYEIARQYMPAPKCNYAKVWVNDEYLGLYNNSESIDENFLEKHFGDGDGTFFKCDPEWRAKQKEGCKEGEKASLMYLGPDPACYTTYYEMKTDEGWEDLLNLMKNLKTDPHGIDELLNVDMALWMHAYNNVLVNLDSYTGRLSHNYYLYKTPDGLFTPLIWDLNLSFGGFRFDGISPRMLTDDDMQTLSPFVHYKTKNAKRPLLVNLLAIPIYRKIYLGHLRTILNDNFANGKYLERANQIRELIDNEVNNDNNKLYDYAGFQKNLTKTAVAGRSKIIGIQELMEKRIEYLSNHKLLQKTPPQISKVTHLRFGDDLAFQATIDIAQSAFAFYRYSPNEPFKMIELFNDGAHNDEMADDEVWGNYIEYKPGIQYYIVAEGERLAMCSPEKASFEFYEVTD